MRDLVVRFPQQLKKAVEISESAKLTSRSGIKNVLITGLGGSGIGATIVTDWTRDCAKLPISVNKGYFLPNFVKKNSLVICSSYSGNTEETYNVLEQAHKSGAKIVCISSGGKMVEFCKKNKIDYIQIPDGMPPRSCVGYSMVQVLKILTFFKIVPNKVFKQLNGGIKLLEKEQKNIDQYTKQISELIYNKMPILYSEDKFEGVTIRYRQQINENAKMLTWHHVIPEMNHNEMVGWVEENNNLVVLFINNALDFSRNIQRRKLNETTIAQYTKNIINIHSKGKNIVEQSLYHIHLADLLSVHLADRRGVDSVDIEVINKLKSALEKQPW